MNKRLESLRALAEEVHGNPEGPHDYDTLQSLSAGVIALTHDVTDALAELANTRISSDGCCTHAAEILRREG